MPGAISLPGIVIYGVSLMPVRPPMFRPNSARKPQPSSRQRYEAKRGSARERGYDAQWDRAALHFKEGAPLCLGCEAIGRLTPTTVVDHVVPHRGDRELFWNEGLWQPSCDWHHNVVKKQLEAKFDRGSIGVADLWLDSPTAKALTVHLLPDRDELDEDGGEVESRGL